MHQLSQLRIALSRTASGRGLGRVFAHRCDDVDGVAVLVVALPKFLVEVTDIDVAKVNQQDRLVDSQAFAELAQLGEGGEVRPILAPAVSTEGQVKGSCHLAVTNVPAEEPTHALTSGPTVAVSEGHIGRLTM